MGGTRINHLNPADRIGNLGCWVATPWTGRDIAKTAARLTADLPFKELALTRLEIVVRTGNATSHQVALAVGAHLEGRGTQSGAGRRPPERRNGVLAHSGRFEHGLTGV